MIYPEHDKLAEIKPLSQTVGGFLEWLGGQGYSICKYERFDRDGVKLEEDEAGVCTEGFYPVHRPIRRWLEEYFEIDGTKLEQEKAQILAQIQTKIPFPGEAM